ncbi:DUF6428 family protein [Roseivirga echinicomitans]
MEFDGTNFLLTNKQTACLALDKCGVPAEKPKIKMSAIQTAEACTPGGGCC